MTSKSAIICRDGKCFPPEALLAAIVLFFMALAAVWVRSNSGPTMWDDSWYLLDSLRMFDALMSRGLPGWFHSFFYEAQMRYKAPLLCALPTPLYLLFGRNSHFALYLNILFMPGLLIGVYWIGKHYCNARVGLLAAFITGSMPQMYGLATWFLVEYGLCVFVVLAIVCLLKSANLTRTRWVALFSVISGLGCLQKILFPAYVLLLVIYFLFKWIQTPRPGSITLAALFLPALAIAGPWYAINFTQAVRRAKFSGYSHEEADLHGTGDPMSLPAALKYIANIINEGMGAPYICASIIVVLAIFWLWFRRHRNPSDARSEMGNPVADESAKKSPAPRGFILLCLLWAAPFCIFLFGHNKAVRFIAPILPVFALVLAFAMDRLIASTRVWGYSIVALLLAGALFFQVQNTFAPIRSLLALSIPRYEHPRGPRRGIWFISPRLGSARMLERERWPLSQLLVELMGETSARTNSVEVMLGWDSNHFNLDNLTLAAVQERLPMTINSTAYYANTSADTQRLIHDIHEATFFLFRQNGEQQNRGYNTLIDVALKEVSDPKQFHSTVSPIQFPDGGTLIIYRNLALAKAVTAVTSSAFIPASVAHGAPCDVTFGSSIALDRLTVQRSGDSIRVYYRWKCLKRLETQYRCFTHVLDENGKFVGWLDHDVLDARPSMMSWQVGDQAWEVVPSMVLPGTKKIHVDIGFYAAGTSDVLLPHLGDSPHNPGISIMKDGIGISVDPDILMQSTRQSGQ